MQPSQVAAFPETLAGTTVLVAFGSGDDRQTFVALEEISRRGGRPGVALQGVGTAIPADLVSYAAMLLVDLRQQPRSDDADATAFALKTRIVAARAATTKPIEIGVAAENSTLDALLSRGLGPYLDFVVLTGAGRVRSAGPALWRAGGTLTSVTGALAQMSSDTADGWLWQAPESADRAGRVVQDLTLAARYLPRGLFPVRGSRVSCGSESTDAFLDPQTLETVAVLRQCAPDTAVAASPAGTSVERVALSDGGVIVRFKPAEPGRFAEGLDVVGVRELTVEEIVARHQTAAARQAAGVRELISMGTQTLSFEAPGFPAPITVSAETTIFTSRDRTDIAQQAIRMNGIGFPGRRLPRLPIIEPERVAAPPLTITLTGVYRYRLAGREEAGGRPCFVVAFEPRDQAASLFRGRAWIAVDDFSMVKVAAVQTGLRGPIVSSEQVDEFESFSNDGFWFLRRSEVRQMYEGAGHRTPILRVLSIARQEPNPADFARRRLAAYQSAAVMLRDTPQGYRYLERPRPAGQSQSGEPAIASRADRVRTLAGGVIIDPNITRPLPFAGLSYVDFDLFKSGVQLNAFFGGTYGQLAFSVPSLGGRRWQLAGRAFGIASSYNDRSFVNGRERYAENIRQRPAHASLWLLRPLTPRIAIRIGYDLDYTHFASGDATDGAFVVPADQIVHGGRLAIDVQRRGWNGSAWWNPAVRSGWRAWGRPASGEFEARQRDFQRYGVSLTRSVVVGPTLSARVEAAWMAGHDLDRFSRYSFGAFDNQLRGYPSALIRYDRGGVTRSVLAWTPGRLARIDAFADYAAVHDPGFGSRLRSYSGIGAALEAPAPFGTLVAVEWGYGFSGVNADGRRGTHVIRVSAYKIF